MYGILIAILFGCFTALGYRSGLNASLTEKQQALLVELSENQNKKPIDSLEYAISVVADQANREKGTKTTTPSTVALALDHTQLSPHESDLFHVLGDDPTGARLRRILIVSNHTSEIPGGDLFLKNTLEDLHEHPLEAMNELTEGLNRVPASGFPLDRAALLNVMNSVGGPSEAVKIHALNELTTNPIQARSDPAVAQNEEQLNAALSTSQDMSLPINAHLVFLKNTNDATEALNGTVQGIVAQPDWGVQTSIAAQFVQAYPDRKSDLSSALSTRGIQIDLRGM